MTDRRLIKETCTVLVMAEEIKLDTHIKRLQELLEQGYISIEIDEGDVGWEVRVTKTRLENDGEYLQRWAETQHKKSLRHAAYLKLHKEFGTT